MPLSARAAVILQYHHVSNSTPKSTSISPTLFEQHLDWIEELGYQVVPLLTIATHIENNQPLGDKWVAITFDDAYRSVWDKAFPLLRERRWPFTVFVQTSTIANDHSLVSPLSKQFMTWQQMSQMAAQGGHIANHTHTHGHMIRRPEKLSESLWVQMLEKDILTAQQLIDKHIPGQPRLFAYPYGEYNEQMRLLLKRLGYFAVAQHSAAVGIGSDIYALSRFAFSGFYGKKEDFVTKLQSLPMPLLREDSSPVGWQITSLQYPGDHWLSTNDYLLPKDEMPPVLKLSLESAQIAQSVVCYASGQGVTLLRVEKNIVYAQAKKALPVGRSRYNCTAPSKQEGLRYYWFSQPWLRKKSDGSWPKEAL